MTDKDIRKLSRIELLEMMIDQTKENEALNLQIETLENKVKALEQELENRKIMIENAGSIAEASLQLNGIFEAAQAAAEEYLENVRQQQAHQQEYAQRAVAETQAKIQNMLDEAQRAETEIHLRVEKMRSEAQLAEKEAQERVQAMLEEAQRTCESMESEASKNCDEMIAKAKQDAQGYWNQVSSRIQGLMKQRADSARGL